MIDVEEKVMEIAADLSGSVASYKLPKRGKREKKTFSYEFDEDDIHSAIDNVCSSWGQNLGTSKQTDGDVIMLKSTSLSGSFSGSLNFGGDASSKVLDMCRSNVKKQRNNMIQVIAQNDFDELSHFCKNYVSKKCKAVKFPKELATKIKELGDKATAETDESEANEDEVKLVEDEKEEL
eukprot:CAMPEP_0197031664 /NCGR_PEP_ID=MMETSP1384-20130603/10602_1 /TAXON_ID=29189 /ORGANISM="Ammonia sp." /LENGTH=178 /DNA_ID=CAMNT_0042461223 /DNA_START=195 /DNA_END=731 /DNA_ORIENTATION=+